VLTAASNWTGRSTLTGSALAAIVLVWVAARIVVPMSVVPDGVKAALCAGFYVFLALGVGRPIIATRGRRNYGVVLVLLAFAVLELYFWLMPVIRSRVLVATLMFVMVMIAVIGGRVIPAFTRNAVAGSNPRHEPWLEVIAFGSLLLIALVTLVGGALTLAAWIPASLFVVAAVAHLLRLALWQPQLTLGNPLLWMMPVAYSWLPVALMLRALSTVAAVVPGAWIHALTMGALSSLMMAMMMRSTLGHTGRSLVASHMDMAAFLALQIAALIRVVAGSAGNYQTLVTLSGLFWVLAFALFLVRYLPMLVQPRVDGKPG